MSVVAELLYSRRVPQVAVLALISSQLLSVPEITVTVRVTT